MAEDTNAADEEQTDDNGIDESPVEATVDEEGDVEEEWDTDL